LFLPAINSAVFSLEGVKLVEGLLGRVRSFRSVNMMSQQAGVPVPFLQPCHLRYDDEMGNAVRVAVSRVGLVNPM